MTSPQHGGRERNDSAGLGEKKKKNLLTVYLIYVRCWEHSCEQHSKFPTCREVVLWWIKLDIEQAITIVIMQK